jgi:hypothetical protein
MEQNTLSNINSKQTRRHERKRSKLITNKLCFEKDKISMEGKTAKVGKFQEKL